MNQLTEIPPTSVEPALRPLTGLVGRGNELGRLLGHLDAHRSVRLQAPRAAGTTALLRALCAEPPRPSAPDGTLALPAGLPVADLPTVAARLQPDLGRAVGQRETLVLLDDRALTADALADLQHAFARSVLVVTGAEDSDAGHLTPVSVHGLSQHHAVGLVEAAMGRDLTIDEGRAAREVATAVHGRPGWLIQAAAVARYGGLTFADVIDLLDDPPRPAALAAALQQGLDDDLGLMLSHLRALGDVAVTTRVAAAVCALEPDEAERRLRRLAALGLVLTDGRDGWTSSAGVAPSSEQVRATTCERLTAWVTDTDRDLDVFDVPVVLSAIASRVDAGHKTAVHDLAQAALIRLPLDGMAATTTGLERALEWSTPEPVEQTPPVPISLPADIEPAEDAPEDAAHSPSEARSHDTAPVPEDAPGQTAPGLETALAADVQPDSSAEVEGTEQPPQDEPPGFLGALVANRRRLALVAIAAAAIIAAVLLVQPMLPSSDEPSGVIRGEVDLGTASIGESNSGTLGLDLSDRGARRPVTLTLSGPDSDAFTIAPTKCDGVDCRASLTFTPDRSGAHVATVKAVDRRETDHAVVEITGTGTGDPSEGPAQTNLAVTLYPTEPSPIPQGGRTVLPVGVTNYGPDDSTGASLAVSVPEGVTAKAAGCTFEDAELTCPLAELPSGSNERIVLDVTAPKQASELRVGATVQPLTDADDKQGDNSAGFTYLKRTNGSSDGP